MQIIYVPIKNKSIAKAARMTTGTLIFSPKKRKKKVRSFCV